MGRLLYELGHVSAKEAHRNQREAAAAGKVGVRCEVTQVVCSPYKRPDRRLSGHFFLRLLLRSTWPRLQGTLGMEPLDLAGYPLGDAPTCPCYLALHWPLFA